VTSDSICIMTLHQDVVADCALELVECFGQFDPGLSSQYLALYQVFILMSVFLLLIWT